MFNPYISFQNSLISNLKNSNIHVHLFNYYFRYYYYFIYLKFYF